MSALLVSGIKDADSKESDADTGQEINRKVCEKWQENAFRRGE